MYEHAPLESFAEVLLRTGKLAETKSEGHDPFPATEGKIYTCLSGHNSVLY